MTAYYRPLAHCGPCRDPDALPLAGGWCWFTRVEVMKRGSGSAFLSAQELPETVRTRLSAPRPDLAGLTMDGPRLMGILNATPDSFSDGGLFLDRAAAVAQGRRMIDEGADLIDIGGESTRPGAAPVPAPEEIDRVAPVIAGLRAGWSGPISIDTRKAAVARAALGAGADLVNDVSALGHDSDMAGLVAGSGVPVCLMHAQGEPGTMQDSPRYDDVLLDVFDTLAGRIAEAEAAGIPRTRILIDPGIGFGKTLEHNLRLLANLSLFHGLGCAILLGASRKRFIGTLSRADAPAARMPGSLAVALAGVAQGVQMLRVHDTAETRQALTLWQAAVTGARA